MAVDELLNEKFRSALEGLINVSERKMMGGVCFMIDGHMVGAAVRTKSGQGRLMFRVGKENDAEAAALPGGEPLIQGGRRMTGFYFIDEDEAAPDTFHRWLSLAVGHAMSLPPKQTRTP